MTINKDNYLTVDELTEIAYLCSALNKVSDAARTNISFDTVPAIEIYDANGDTLGWVRMSEGGSYAFHLTSGELEDDDV